MKKIAGLNGRFLFMLSTGRDSVVMLDLVLKNIDPDRIDIVYLWFYPKGILTYRDRYLERLSKKYQKEIFYEPHFEAWMVNKKFPKVKYSVQRDYLMEKYNCDWCFYGWRKGESFQRNIILSHTDEGIPKSHDPDGKKYNDPQTQLYPLWNMNEKDVIRYAIENDLELSPEYDYHFRDVNIFNGLSVQWLHDVYPDDYKRMARKYPQIELEYEKVTHE